jgi:predicted RNase H-like HicB family nuclease
LPPVQSQAAIVPTPTPAWSLFAIEELNLSNMGKKGNVMGMKFVITLERDEDGVWVAECPSIPGCVSQGKTRDDAMANVREAIAACLEVRAERGLPLTVETHQVEVAL